MEVKLIFWIVTIFYCSLEIYAAKPSKKDQDPCFNHDTVREQYDRSLGYKRPRDHSTSALCDQFRAETWTRFTGRQGGDMITTPPEPESCGTTFPIWLNGELPQDDQIHEIEACVRTFAKICEFKYDVHVKNCGDFNVYKLPRTRGCPQAYCVGTEVPCPKGESSRNGWTPGCRGGGFPTLKGEPVIGTGFIQEGDKRGSKRQVEMTCDIQHPREADIVYDIYWYIEEKLIHQQTGENAVKKEDMPARIREDQGLKIGTNLKCEVFPRYSFSEIVGFRKEASYFMGFQVSSRLLKVYEGEEDTVYEIRPTIPILCLVGFEDDCQLSISVQQPVRVTDGKPAVCSNGNNMDQVAFKFVSTRCAIDIPMTTNIFQTYTLGIGAALDGIYDGDHVVEIAFKTSEINLHHKLWENYDLPSAQVHVIDKDTSIGGKSCRVVDDPHITTFDGRRYEHHYEGEFVMYRHTTLPVEVQAYFRKCLNRHDVTCVCGAAIRSGGDLFMYDHCRDHKPYRIKMYACRSGSLKVEKLKNAHSYRIHLPTGGKVELGSSTIRIYPSLSDVGKTEGLCGTFDDRCQNDFKLPDGTYSPHDGGPCHSSWRFYPGAFSLSWRVKREHSLYRGKYRDDYIPSNIVYCSCKINEVTNKPETVCGEMGEAAIQYCVKRDQTDRHTGRCLKRRKRSTDSDDYFDDDIEEEVEMFPYDPNHKPAEPSWKDGWTEAKAREECIKYIKNKPGTQTCISEGVGDVQEAVDACVADIQLTSDTEYSIVHLEQVLSKCTTEISRNMTYYAYEPSATESENNETVIELKTPALLLQSVCPGDCNEHGDCQNGTCHCYGNYTGADCSEEKNKIPQLFDLPNDGMCDLQNRPCLMTPITGDYFIETEKLMCRIQPVKLLKNNEQIILGGIKLAEPEFDHSQRILCAISERDSTDKNVLTHGYHISISNDGVSYSEIQTITVFDSKCMNCTGSLQCTQLPNTCLHRGTCYEDGEHGKVSMFCYKCKGETGIMERQETMNDTCFILNKCYKTGDVNYDNLCEECDPSVSSSKWTKVTSDKCSGGNYIVVSVLTLMTSLICSYYLTNNHVELPKL